jgi:hypothetical protein
MISIHSKQFPDAGRIQMNSNIFVADRIHGKLRTPDPVRMHASYRIHTNPQISQPAGFQLKLILLGAATLLVFLSLGNDSSAQMVYSVDYPNQADVKVYVVRYQNQADLNVFRVQYRNQAGTNNGLWFFTDYPNQADKKIYFVDYPNQADLNIHFVRYRNQAGWRSNARKHLMY